jgi:acetyl esterase/lipase
MIKVDLDQPYSREYQPARRMDLFVPDQPNGAAVLLVHGGGWRGGDKAQWHTTALHLAGRGYVCASATYRLAPAAKFPAQIEDVRLAMAVFRAGAAQMGFAPSRIAAMGSSSGGHLAALLGTIAAGDALGMTAEMPVDDTRPNAVVAYCPVTDLHQNRPDAVIPDAVLDLLGRGEADDPALYRQASPVDRITGQECPFLFVHGDADTTVPHVFSLEMAAKLRQVGVGAEVEILPGVGHGFGYGVLSDAQKQSLALVQRFFEKSL